MTTSRLSYIDFCFEKPLDAFCLLEIVRKFLFFFFFWFSSSHFAKKKIINMRAHSVYSQFFLHEYEQRVHWEIYKKKKKIVKYRKKKKQKEKWHLWKSHQLKSIEDRLLFSHLKKFDNDSKRTHREREREREKTNIKLRQIFVCYVSLSFSRRVGFCATTATRAPCWTNAR